MKLNLASAFFILCSLLILYPKNLEELFYYDDNPVRYAIAKKWVENKLSYDEKILFLAYGSSEIYIPFFYIAKFLNISYELTYNLVSLVLFISTLLYVMSLTRREEKNFYFITGLFTLFGIVCVAKGSLHWFIASSIIFGVLCSKSVKILHYVMVGFSYIISPPSIVPSVLISLALLFNGERKKSMVFILSLPMLLVKIVLVHPIVILDAKRSLDRNFGKGIIDWSLNSFCPPDLRVFIRPILLDYFKAPVLPALVLYTISMRAILTKDRFAILLFSFFYVTTLFSVFIIKLQLKGYEISKYLVSIFSFIFASNPFRHVPLLMSYLIIKSDQNKYDKILTKFILVSLFFYSISSLIKDEGELPTGFPKEIKSIIEFLRNSDSKNILFEGDIHTIQNNKLIHPLYNSHIIPYISEEVEGKKFYGGIIPLYSSKYNFFAGRFNLKHLENSDILDFIEDKKIDMVICWTDICSEFFSSSYEKEEIGKFKIIRLK